MAPLSPVRTHLSDTLTRAAGRPVELQFVTFNLGAEQFAVDILAVQEINRMPELTRVPQSPSDIEGVINLRGRIIPVIDLHRRFNLPPAACSDSSRVIIIEIAGRTLAFRADCVHDVLRIDSSIVEPAPAFVRTAEIDYLAGVAKLPDRLVILLDIDRLFLQLPAGAIAA